MLKISRIVAQKVTVHIQLNLKNAGNIREMDLLKNTFDNKILTNESNAVHRGNLYSKLCCPSKIRIAKLFPYIFNFLFLTFNKT